MFYFFKHISDGTNTGDKISEFQLRTPKNGEPQLTTMEDVYKEFDEYASKTRIMEFNCKETKKHYSFEKEGTPKTSDYLEVRYNARYPAIDADYSGPAIERVFGTTVNAMELLLIERKIKGPGWLDVKNVSPTAGRFAWCQQIVSAKYYCCIVIKSQSLIIIILSYAGCLMLSVLYL